VWKYLIVLCMANDFNGAPVNKCFSTFSVERYTTKEACVAQGKLKDMEVYLRMRELNEGLPIIKVVCSQEEVIIPMSNRVPTFEEIREALKLPVEITVRHDAMGRVIKKNNYSDVNKVKKTNPKGAK